MPGVPSGKGCDGCRKQKKKCDQAKPACSRCSRLSIPCVGGGKQRYKFKVQVLETTPFTAVTTSKKVRVLQSPVSLLVPRGRNATIAGILISRLEVKDVRYDINTYGMFLRRIPERIGMNEALDASVDAFTAAFSTIYTGEFQVGALTKYGDALRAVRGCLNDPQKGPTVETMCAIYLIMIIQSWMGPTDPRAPSHAEGLAHLLRATVGRKTTSDFEKEIILCMCIPVILESIINPRIKLNPWFSSVMDQFPVPSGPKPAEYEKLIKLNPDVFPSLTIRSISRLPGYLDDPVTHHLDILSAYHLLRFDIQKLHNKTKHVTELDLAIRPGFSYETARHGFEVAYSLCLSLTLVINTILLKFDPSDVTLIKESTACVDKIIHQAEISHHLRPLGSSQIPLCLAVSWAVTKDPALKAYIETLMDDYRHDFKNCDWIKMGQWWQVRFKNISHKVAAWKDDGSRESSWDLSPENEMQTVDGDCSVQ